MSRFSVRRPIGYTPHHLYSDERSERVSLLMRQAEGKDGDADVRRSFSRHWAEQTRNLRCRRHTRATGRIVLLLILAVMAGLLLIS